MTIDIAVLGSCVSRDLFNSKFNENYKDFYRCVLTQNQTSIISLMSRPFTYRPDPQDGLSSYQEWNVRTDWSKEFLQDIKDKQPGYLLLDFFADVHFGCVQIGEQQWITDNRWMVQKTSQYRLLLEEEHSRRLNLQDNTAEYFDLWKASIDKLFSFLKREVPHCKVILNQARNVTTYVTDTGEAKSLGDSGKVYPIDVEKLNELWDLLDGYVQSNYSVHSIRMPKENLTSYEAHPWGPFYLHYTMDYYHDCMNELHRIVLKDRVPKAEADLCTQIVDELGKADVDKTKAIRRKTETIRAYQKKLSAIKRRFVPMLFYRLNRVFQRKVVRLLRNS